MDYSVRTLYGLCGFEPLQDCVGFLLEMWFTGRIFCAVCTILAARVRSNGYRM